VRPEGIDTGLLAAEENVRAETVASEILPGNGLIEILVSKPALGQVHPEKSAREASCHACASSSLRLEVLTCTRAKPISKRGREPTGFRASRRDFAQF
jgi:hypothetical protein